MENYNNKTLLITGGTGSFGNAVLKSYLNRDFKEIRIFSRDEKKQEDMRIALKSDKVKFFIGDVRDEKSVDDVMVNVDYVFHAAALKQVPSCEFYPMQAIKTNVIGAENVLDSAYRHNVNKVVVLSTDKAVYPINAMGLTKAMMEKLMIAKSRILKENNVFCATRYGNVMASRGSVIPLFVDQIKSGKPVTITDPNMTRFMMSLTESVNLVEFAFNNAMPGDIFVQKAPATTIELLALALKEIFNASNPVKILGTRHGEKLYETLLTREEMVKAEDLGDFYRIPADSRDLNYAKYFVDGEIKTSEFDDYNSHNTQRLDLNATVELLLNLDYIQEQLKQ
ncbi:polysaccharide biosynthesis protein [Saccharicrinis sp. FJH62]|uniref:polysaccharide biosynthesis protein n=1 Tax=Saccharicrinis sp. FJH62 TaxID=3344657 RepID=UPI0035D4D5E4